MAKSVGESLRLPSWIYSNWFKIALSALNRDMVFGHPLLG